MSEFAQSFTAKVSVRSLQNAGANGPTESILRAALKCSENLPYIGVVAQLFGAVLAICDQSKCNKEAFAQLKIRVFHFVEIFFGEGGLLEVVQQRSDNQLLSKFTKRLEDILNNGIAQLVSFTKVGHWFTCMLSGSMPLQRFNKLDADLTECRNNLTTILQVTQINEQKETYKVVCDIQVKLGSLGGLQGVYNDPELLQTLADEIGADVADLRKEVKESLELLEAERSQVAANASITDARRSAVARDVHAISHAEPATANESPLSSDQAALALTSDPFIDHDKVLGQGCFGTVYEGKYGAVDVAVKTITATTGLTARQLSELTKEVLMHSKVCNLPGVVRLFGANLSAHPRCIVLELADGSLHDVLHKRKPAIDLCLTSKLFLAVQVSSAMACISEMGIIHRDIKSSNVLIFLQSRGRVAAKLADFGLAKINTENTYATSQTPKGTPPYMAPELFRGTFVVCFIANVKDSGHVYAGEYSSASDVYAFTVMVNELLLEEIPFPSASLSEIIRKVDTLKQRPKPFTAPATDPVGCRLMSLVRIGWNQDPALRMSFQSLDADLSELLITSVEFARNGTRSAPNLPASALTAETAITALTEWLNSSCGLLADDSASLAHTLVTTKSITSVNLLMDVLLHHPTMLTADLRVPIAQEIQIKQALRSRQPKQKEWRPIGRWALLVVLAVVLLLLPLYMRGHQGDFTALLFGDKARNETANSTVAVEGFLDEMSALTPLHQVNSHNGTANVTATSEVFPDQISALPALLSDDPHNETTIPFGAAELLSSSEAERLYVVARFASNTTAVQQLIDAASKQNHLAEAYLSILCDRGCNGLTKDANIAVSYAEMALPWLRAEAENGNKYAQFHLGFCYDDGRGVAKDAGEAVRWYALAADQGHGIALNNLGICYEHGTGVPKNPVEAVRLYALAAEQGLVQAQFNLGRCYEYGTGVAKNPAEAVRLYRLAAEQGYALAQFALGLAYANGAGVAKNPAEAVRLYTLGADQGNAESQNNLGYCYNNGVGVAKNPVEAVRLYTLAAEQGNAAAQNNLGICHYNGDGVAKNPVEAVRLYTLAAEQGHALAQFNLGNCYADGTGVTENLAEAVRLYTLAAEQGHAPAQNSLGRCYANGNGVPKDHVEAVRLYTLAADQGHAVAQYNLGRCYANGTGVSKNPAEAVRLYTLAAEQGHAAAQNSLGYFYDTGVGVTKDHGEAVRLYSLAAGQRHAVAQYNLGLCYEYGTGVPKNLEKAVRLYTLAAEQGQAQAQYYLGRCYANGTGVVKNLEEAVKFYSLAAAQGNALAQFALGLCYANGTGVTKNPSEAVRLYTRAAEQGYAQAQNNLGHCYDNGVGVTKDPEEAVRLYTLAAGQGLASAQFNLGLCYEYGTGVPKNPKEAVRFYALAAEQGQAQAQYYLGLAYTNGTGVTKNLEKAVSLYTLAAEQGHAQAQNSLGHCYYNGFGVTRDLAKAIKFFSLAAEQGNEVAQKNLGIAKSAWW